MPMVVVEITVKCRGIRGYGRDVKMVIMEINSEKIFFTRYNAAERWILLMTRRPSATISGMAAKSESSSTSCAT